MTIQERKEESGGRLGEQARNHRKKVDKGKQSTCKWGSVAVKPRSVYN